MELGATQTHINQLRKDAATISSYAPMLVPVGTALSLGSRIGMLRAGKKGIALALLSIPLNSILVPVGYGVQLNLMCDDEATANK